VPHPGTLAEKLSLDVKTVAPLGARRNNLEARQSTGIGWKDRTERRMAKRREAFIRRRIAVGFTQEALAAELGLEAKTVARWERGETTPKPHHRPDLACALDVSLDFLAALLVPGAINRRDPVNHARRPAAAPDVEVSLEAPDGVSLEDVDRKTFLKTALGAGAGIAVSRYLARPVVDRDELVATVARPTSDYRRMESAVSSAILAPAVDAHLELTKGIVASTMHTSTGFRVLAEIAGLAAWLAADRGDDATARRRYRDAVEHAEHAAHPLLAAYMTASLGQYAVESGDASHGVELLDKAREELPLSAPNTAHAWLASLHAVAYAASGDRPAALNSLRRAEKLTTRQDHETAWPWVFTFDTAKAARYQAEALGYLGDLQEAQAAFTAAHPALTAPKPRALAQIRQANVLAGAGRIDDGCQLAIDALAVGRAFGSARVITQVRSFRASVPTRTVAARELDKALAALHDEET
jgi:transcriptional regulator with XRE-family HTH domain